ncbi:hypothetical protein HDV00_007202 [Rhizophlyctis rosea]|nr:hypothetical protein HDV00_007202 [Rhizophlyctis rosea]
MPEPGISNLEGTVCYYTPPWLSVQERYLVLVIFHNEELNRLQVLPISQKPPFDNEHYYMGIGSVSPTSYPAFNWPVITSNDSQISGYLDLTDVATVERGSLFPFSIYINWCELMEVRHACLSALYGRPVLAAGRREGGTTLDFYQTPRPFHFDDSPLKPAPTASPISDSQRKVPVATAPPIKDPVNQNRQEATPCKQTQTPSIVQRVHPATEMRKAAEAHIRSIKNMVSYLDSGPQTVFELDDSSPIGVTATVCTPSPPALSSSTTPPSPSKPVLDQSAMDIIAGATKFALENVAGSSKSAMETLAASYRSAMEKLAASYKSGLESAEGSDQSAPENVRAGRQPTIFESMGTGYKLGTKHATALAKHLTPLPPGASGPEATSGTPDVLPGNLDFQVPPAVEPVALHQLSQYPLRGTTHSQRSDPDRFISAKELQKCNKAIVGESMAGLSGTNHVHWSELSDSDLFLSDEKVANSQTYKVTGYEETRESKMGCEVSGTGDGAKSSDFFTYNEKYQQLPQQQQQEIERIFRLLPPIDISCYNDQIKAENADETASSNQDRTEGATSAKPLSVMEHANIVMPSLQLSNALEVNGNNAGVIKSGEPSTITAASECSQEAEVSHRPTVLERVAAGYNLETEHAMATAKHPPNPLPSPSSDPSRVEATSKTLGVLGSKSSPEPPAKLRPEVNHHSGKTLKQPSGSKPIRWFSDLDCSISAPPPKPGPVVNHQQEKTSEGPTGTKPVRWFSDSYSFISDEEVAKSRSHKLTYPLNFGTKNSDNKLWAGGTEEGKKGTAPSVTHHQGVKRNVQSSPLTGVAEYKNQTPATNDPPGNPDSNRDVTETANSVPPVRHISFEEAVLQGLRRDGILPAEESTEDASEDNDATTISASSDDEEDVTSDQKSATEIIAADKKSTIDGGTCTPSHQRDPCSPPPSEHTNPAIITKPSEVGNETNSPIPVAPHPSANSQTVGSAESPIDIAGRMMAACREALQLFERLKEAEKNQNLRAADDTVTESRGEDKSSINADAGVPDLATKAACFKPPAQPSAAHTQAAESAVGSSNWEERKEKEHVLQLFHCLKEEDDQTLRNAKDSGTASPKEDGSSVSGESEVPDLVDPDIRDPQVELAFPTNPHTVEFPERGTVREGQTKGDAHPTTHVDTLTQQEISFMEEAKIVLWSLQLNDTNQANGNIIKAVKDQEPSPIPAAPEVSQKGVVSHKPVLEAQAANNSSATESDASTRSDQIDSPPSSPPLKPTKPPTGSKPTEYPNETVHPTPQAQQPTTHTQTAETANTLRARLEAFQRLLTEHSAQPSKQTRLENVAIVNDNVTESIKEDASNGAKTNVPDVLGPHMTHQHKAIASDCHVVETLEVTETAHQTDGDVDSTIPVGTEVHQQNPGWEWDSEPVGIPFPNDTDTNLIKCGEINDPSSVYTSRSTSPAPQHVTTQLSDIARINEKLKSPFSKTTPTEPDASLEVLKTKFEERRAAGVQLGEEHPYVVAGDDVPMRDAALGKNTYTPKPTTPWTLKAQKLRSILDTTPPISPPPTETPLLNQIASLQREENDTGTGTLSTPSCEKYIDNMFSALEPYMSWGDVPNVEDAGGGRDDGGSGMAENTRDGEEVLKGEGEVDGGGEMEDVWLLVDIMPSKTGTNDHVSERDSTTSSRNETSAQPILVPNDPSKVTNYLPPVMRMHPAHEQHVLDLNNNVYNTFREAKNPSPSPVLQSDPANNQTSSIDKMKYHLAKAEEKLQYLRDNFRKPNKPIVVSATVPSVPSPTSESSAEESREGKPPTSTSTNNQTPLSKTLSQSEPTPTSKPQPTPNKYAISETETLPKEVLEQSEALETSATLLGKLPEQTSQQIPSDNHKKVEQSLAASPSRTSPTSNPGRIFPKPHTPHQSIHLHITQSLKNPERLEQEMYHSISDGLFAKDVYESMVERASTSPAGRILSKPYIPNKDIPLHITESIKNLERVEEEMYRSLRDGMFAKDVYQSMVERAFVSLAGTGSGKVVDSVGESVSPAAEAEYRTKHEKSMIERAIRGEGTVLKLVDRSFEYMPGTCELIDRLRDGRDGVQRVSPAAEPAFPKSDRDSSLEGEDIAIGAPTVMPVEKDTDTVKSTNTTTTASPTPPNHIPPFPHPNLPTLPSLTPEATLTTLLPLLKFAKETMQKLTTFAQTSIRSERTGHQSSLHDAQALLDHTLQNMTAIFQKLKAASGTLVTSKVVEVAENDQTLVARNEEHLAQNLLQSLSQQNTNLNPGSPDEMKAIIQDATSQLPNLESVSMNNTSSPSTDSSIADGLDATSGIDEWEWVEANPEITDNSTMPYGEDLTERVLTETVVKVYDTDRVEPEDRTGEMSRKAASCRLSDSEFEEHVDNCVEDWFNNEIRDNNQQNPTPLPSAPPSDVESQSETNITDTNIDDISNHVESTPRQELTGEMANSGLEDNGVGHIITTVITTTTTTIIISDSESDEGDGDWEVLEDSE